MDCNQIYLIQSYSVIPLLVGAGTFLPQLALDLYRAKQNNTPIMDVIVSPMSIILGIVIAVALFGNYLVGIMCLIKYELALVVYSTFLAACVILGAMYSNLNIPWQFVYNKYMI